ncbi:unnamed protein product [Brassica oleracea]
MSSIGASYAPLYLMQKQLKEKKKIKREKERADKAQSLAVGETSLDTGRKSNRIYPSRSSYSEHVERPNHKSKI